MIFEVGAPPPKVDPQLVKLHRSEWFEYGPNTRSVKRNQVENTRTAEKTSASLQAPKFLSEKARESANEAASMERRISDVADAIGAAELSSLKAEVPVMYRNVEIKYSKFGVDDFDFGYENIERKIGLANRLQFLQQNGVLRTRDPYLELLRQSATAGHAFHPLDTECGFAAHCNWVH